jgi:hypothetical protein
MLRQRGGSKARRRGPTRGMTTLQRHPPFDLPSRTLDRAVRWLDATLVLGLLLGSAPGVAHARENGIAVDGCSGCHNGGKDAKVALTANPSTVAPGGKVRLTISIEAVNGNKAGFFFRTTAGVGTVSLVSGEPTRLSGANNGVIHAMPKTGDGKQVSFALDYTAPSTPGDVELNAFGLSANGDGRSSGDGAGSAYLSLAFGCTAGTYYQDNDDDGYGSEDSPPRVACSKPMYFAPSKDDCLDSVETIHPGALEACNGSDDDCDGMVDEGLVISTYCEDKDGDGHGVRGGKTMSGCGPLIDFGLCDDDCNDADKSVFPTAPEACNYKDDNCNNRIDENARMTCGEGWCRRSSEGCMAALCVPGEPRAEQCNALDDDCDGVIDNGASLCPGGQTCIDGTCGGGALLDAGGVVRRDASAPVITSDGAVIDAPPEAQSDSGCALHGRRSGALLLVLLGYLARRRRA